MLVTRDLYLGGWRQEGCRGAQQIKVQGPWKGLRKGHLSKSVHAGFKVLNKNMQWNACCSITPCTVTQAKSQLFYRLGFDHCQRACKLTLVLFLLFCSSLQNSVPVDLPSTQSLSSFSTWNPIPRSMTERLKLFRDLHMT